MADKENETTNMKQAIISDKEQTLFGKIAETDHDTNKGKYLQMICL